MKLFSSSLGLGLDGSEKGDRKTADISSYTDFSFFFCFNFMLDNVKVKFQNSHRKSTLITEGRVRKRIH